MSKASSVRERFNNLLSNTRTALAPVGLQHGAVKPESRDRGSLAPLSQAAPEPVRHELSREAKSVQSDPDHEPDVPGMDT